jgi:hypothetical protein
MIDIYLDMTGYGWIWLDMTGYPWIGLDMPVYVWILIYIYLHIQSYPAIYISRHIQGDPAISMNIHEYAAIITGYGWICRYISISTHIHTYPGISSDRDQYPSISLHIDIDICLHMTGYDWRCLEMPGYP